MTLFHVVARYRTYPDASRDVLSLLEKMATATRKEAGNLSYDVYQAVEDERQIVILETYQSAEDFDLHRQSPHFLSIGAGQIIPRLEHRSISTYTSETSPPEAP